MGYGGWPTLLIAGAAQADRLQTPSTTNTVPATPPTHGHGMRYSTLPSLTRQQISLCSERNKSACECVSVWPRASRTDGVAWPGVATCFL